MKKEDNKQYKTGEEQETQEKERRKFEYQSHYKYKTKMGKYIHYLNMRVKKNEKAFRIYTILRVLVVITLIRCIFEGNFESAALCVLSLVLFLLPSFAEEKLHVEIPAPFQIIIYLFIYAAWILGEVNKFYTAIPGWDTMLHTINGFLCAAIGFSLVDLFNRTSSRVNLSPFYLAVVAFCFSMTIGVLWEFIEFTVDSLFYLDMQKDTIVQTIGSVTLDPTHSQIPIRVSGITETVIYTSSGKTYTIEGGYLDIGLVDTMKDLIVNFIGAVAFSIIGYIYTKTHNPHAGEIAEGLHVTRSGDVSGDERLEEQKKAVQEEREERKQARRVRQASRDAARETIAASRNRPEDGA